MTMFNEYFTGNCSISLENVKYEKINEFGGNQIYNRIVISCK